MVLELPVERWLPPRSGVLIKVSRWKENLRLVLSLTTLRGRRPRSAILRCCSQSLVVAILIERELLLCTREVATTGRSRMRTTICMCLLRSGLRLLRRSLLMRNASVLQRGVATTAWPLLLHLYTVILLLLWYSLREMFLETGHKFSYLSQLLRLVSSNKSCWWLLRILAAEHHGILHGRGNQV